MLVDRIFHGVTEAAFVVTEVRFLQVSGLCLISEKCHVHIKVFSTLTH